MRAGAREGRSHGWSGSHSAQRPTFRACLVACPILCPQVKVTMGKFEERLWSIIRNFVAVSQEEPGLLVTALQVRTAGVIARALPEY